MSTTGRNRTLVLGAGFGGLTVATELRRLLGAGHEIVLVDRREHFSMGLRKLWELVGHAPIAEGSRSRDGLAEQGIRIVREEVRAIDPAGRTATMDSGTIEAGHLVVALGAEPRPDLIPGLAEHGHDVWDIRGVRPAADHLARFDGGRIVVLVAGAPYPCPPAPYECAFHVDENLRSRGLRDRTELTVATIQPMLMPNAGADGSSWIAGLLEERGIHHRAGVKVERVAGGRVVLGGNAGGGPAGGGGAGDGPGGSESAGASGREILFDILIGVPPHRPPAVVKECGLTGDGDWVKVNPATLETAYPGVHAIGDVTQIKLANGLPLPKAGVFAELEGKRVAAAIAAEARGDATPPDFDGRGYCFFEMGTESAAMIEGDFFATPEPRVTLAEPNAAHAAEKREFETERLRRWFGR